MLIDAQRLLDETRRRTDDLRAVFAAMGNTEADKLLDHFARVVQDAVQACLPDPEDRLTLAEAAAWSGYSRGYITRLMRYGAIRNYGRPRKPRLRRGDLPRKGDGAAWTLHSVGR